MRLVYFTQHPETGAVKIGCSAHLERRFAQLRCDMKADLQLLASVPGDFHDEERLHRQLASHRRVGEWFNPHPEVMAVIRHVQFKGALPPVPEDDREIVFARRYLAGETLQQIASDFGVSRERVRQVLRKSRVPSLGHRAAHRIKAAPITAEERVIADRYLAGETLAALAAEFPHLSVASSLHRTGALGNKQKPISDKRMREVVELYAAGVKATEIGQRLGLSHYNHVYTYLARAGVKPSRAKRKRGELDALAPQIIAAYRGGQTVKQVADAFESSTAAIANLLRRHDAMLSTEETERRRIVAVRAANRRRRAA